jgi:tetratricopeptide (TPR) repeat protein
MEVNVFGTRLRQVRLRAGLSQSDLALGLMSPSHISLMESGRRSPSSELLEQLAERLGVATEYLISGPSFKAIESRRKDLLFAEIALKNGDAEFAENALSSLISALEPGESPEFAVRSRHLFARVLERLGRLEEAASELRKAIDIAETSGLPLEAVEMTITLSNCARESGDFLKALELITAAQESFPVELRNSATYARLLSNAIGIHYVRGDYLRAQDLSEQALSVFDHQTDPAAQAAILWNASLAADANQDITKALLLAQRAAGLYSESDDRRSEGVLRIAISWLFTRQTPPNTTAAIEQLIQAESLLEDYGTAIDRAALETEFSRVEWLQDNFEGALRYATSALSRLSGANDRLQSAEAHLLVARAQISLGNEVESSMNLTVARNILAAMEPSRVNAFAWRELGDIYARQGFTDEALTAYREALHDAGVPASPLAFSETQNEESQVLLKRSR